MNITAENIKMKIGDNEILKGVSIDSKNREFVGIIGPNGSGKSTLLKSIYRIGYVSFLRDKYIIKITTP